jgi:hypothetical protein
MYPSVRAPFQSLVVPDKDHIVPHFHHNRYSHIKLPENKVVQRSQEYVMAGLLTIMGVMIKAIFLKLIWHSFGRP